MTSQRQRAERFRDLHQGPGMLVLPNPWDAGSAKMLASLGFDALATTSAGLAFSLGRRDAEGAVSRTEALENARAIVAATDLPVDRFLDREISWLQFNERVLQLAADESVPLLERARFLAIFTSNLDEFFMVRVAGLKRRINTGLAVPTVTGRMPLQVMHAISIRAHELMTRHAELLKNEIGPLLDAEAITKVSMDELTESERARVDDRRTCAAVSRSCRRISRATRA